jgi:TolA-binding protein
MFNAFKSYDEGNLKIANSKDGKITPDIRKTFNSTIDKCWKLINMHGDSSDWADDALLLIGKSHFLLEEYSKADRFLDQFIKKYPRSELINESKIWYAKVLVKTEDDEKALTILNEMLLNDMDNDLKSEALNSVGSIYYLREEFEESINKLNQCIEISDNDLLSASSQLQIGKIYFDLGQYVNAIENFNYVLDYDPPEELEFKTLMNKVDAQIKLNKIDLALKTLSQMLRNTKIKDKHSLVEAKLGECYVLQDKKEYATEHLYDVIERYPKSLGSAWSTFQLANLLENYYFNADSARKLYLKVKQESSKSEYIDQSTQRANLLKSYLDLKTKIQQINEDIFKYSQMLLDTLSLDTNTVAFSSDTLSSDTLTDSLTLISTSADTDSVVAPEKKETKENIAKKLRESEKSLSKNRYNLAEFFLLNMQNYDSAATTYIDFINAGIDSAKIPKAYHALSYIYYYKINDSTKADSVDKLILNRFPESPYSDFILTRNSPIQKEAIVDKNPMKDRFLVAEQYLFADNFTIALDSLVYIAENDSGNDWGGKARYAISWIYENKLHDISKAVESYALLAKEYPGTKYAIIAKNKIKEPKVEVPVDTTKSDSLRDELKSDITDSLKNPQDEKIEDEDKKEDIKKEDGESTLKDEEKNPIPSPYGLRLRLEIIESIEKGIIWKRYMV